MKDTYKEIKRLTGITVEPHTAPFSGAFSYWVNFNSYVIADNAVEALFLASQSDREVYNALIKLMNAANQDKHVELWALVDEEQQESLTIDAVRVEMKGAR